MTMLESLTEIEQAVIEEIPVVLKNQAEAVRANIIERTTSGRDVEGRFFAGYQPGYAKRRKLGRRRPVTLVDKGIMLPAIRIDRIRMGYNVTMPRRQMHKAGPLYHGRKDMAARRFWGISARKAAMLQQEFGQRMTTSIGRRRRDGGVDRRFTFKIGIR